MPGTGVVQLSAVERKLHNKSNGTSVKRAKSFNSTSAPTSPSALRRSKQPTLEPRYNKSTHLLIEAKRLAKELEERKKNGNPLMRPSSAKTINFSASSRNRAVSSGSSALAARMKRTLGETGLQAPSPVMTSKQLSRRRAKSQYCRVSTDSTDKDGTSPVPLDGRFTPLRGSGRKRNYVVPSPGKNCDECRRTLKSGYFSEHRGLPYCNVPCYSSLFSSLLNREADDDSCSSLAEDQKQLRTSLIPKLRTYNTYYSGKPCQISCREINDKFVLEGVIKVYWGLRSPVTLADSEVSHYWKHFQPDDGERKDNSENVPPNIIFDDKARKKFSLGIRRGKNNLNGTNGIHDHNKYRYKRKESGGGGGSENSVTRKRIGCSVCNVNNSEATSFIPPYATPTTLRITNHVTVPLVIEMLLKKFQIKDTKTRFALYTVYESGGQRKLKNDSYPLLTRLSLGPCEDVAKIFIMDAADGTEIPLEVAQYINFNTVVLETFVKKFHEEEEREIDRIKEKYLHYKELLGQRIQELERNNNCVNKQG